MIGHSAGYEIGRGPHRKRHPGDGPRSYRKARPLDYFPEVVRTRHPTKESALWYTVALLGGSSSPQTEKDVVGGNVNHHAGEKEGAADDEPRVYEPFGVCVDACMEQIHSVRPGIDAIEKYGHASNGSRHRLSGGLTSKRVNKTSMDVVDLPQNQKRPCCRP